MIEATTTLTRAGKQSGSRLSIMAPMDEQLRVSPDQRARFGVAG